MMTSKSTLANEQLHFNILNDTTALRTSRIEPLQLFSPTLSTRTTEGINATSSPIHRSINHLAKEISGSTSATSANLFSIAVPSDITVPCTISATASCISESANDDDLHCCDGAPHIGRGHCYDEGTYLYTSDEMVIESDEKKSLLVSEAESATAIESEIAHCYATAQSQVRAENYLVAIKYFEMTLEVIKKLQVDKDASHIIISLMQHQLYHNVAHCYFRLNQKEIAVSFAQMSLQVAANTDVNTPIHVAAAHNTIAVLHLQEMEQRHQSCRSTSDAILERNIWILQKCYEVYVQVFGLNSKEAATILYNFGRVCFLVEKYDNAIQAFKQCLHVRQSVFSVNVSDNNKHNNLMDIAICMSNIGQVFHKMGQYNVAMEFYQRFLDLHHENKTIYHSDVAKTILYMADICTLEGNVNGAMVKYEYIIEYGFMFFGTKNGATDAHSCLVTAYKKLGDIRTKKREYHAALAHYVKSYTMENDLRCFQAMHQQCCIPTVSMIVAMFKIANVQRKLKLHSSAVQIYMRLYDLHVNTYGPYSLEVGRILSNIGSTLYDAQKFPLALEFFLDALKVQMICHPFQDTVEVATILNSIGLIYFLQQQYPSAELCFTESLRMNTKILGYNHYDNSILWYNIASTNYEQGFHDKAIKFYEAAIRIEALQGSQCTSGCSDYFDLIVTGETALGEGQGPVGRHQRRANNTRSLQKLGSIYEKQADLQKAKESYLQALNIELSLRCQQNIPTIAKLFNVIGNIFLQEADIKPMMECYTTSARLFQHHKLTTDRLCDGMDTVQTGHSKTADCALIIAGYKYYYLSRMNPPAAANA